MPRVAKPLSPQLIDRLHSPGYHTVGTVPGLNLYISETGSRSWILRATMNGKRREFGLGPYPTVDVNAAYRKATQYRLAIADGIDPTSLHIPQSIDLPETVSRISVETVESPSTPVAHANKLSEWTFQKCVERYIEIKEATWKNNKHAQQWRSTLETYAYPIIGNLPVATITEEHIIEILRPEWRTRTETLNRVRNRIEIVLDWASENGFCTAENPARWKNKIGKHLPSRRKISPRVPFAAISIKQMPKFMASLRDMPGIASRCFEFMILTGRKSKDVRYVTWEDIDWEKRIWVLGAKYNQHTERRLSIPLSDEAIQLLAAIKPITSGKSIIFTGRKQTALSDMALTAILRRMHIDAQPDGFRKTFATWLFESRACSSYVQAVATGKMIIEENIEIDQAVKLQNEWRQLMHDWATFLKAAEK